jgi:transcriptional regulator with XRE-family HTH domain
MLENFARELAATRVRLGLTQNEFAARLGVSQGAVSRWEKGRHRPATEVLMRLGMLSPGTSPLFGARTTPPAQDLPPLGRGPAGRMRLRLRPLEEPHRRLSDHLEDGIACATRSGRGDLADELRAILERCLAAERQGAAGGRRASDLSS